jgi:hypothetical protein
MPLKEHSLGHIKKVPDTFLDTRIAPYMRIIGNTQYTGHFVILEKNPEQ